MSYDISKMSKETKKEYAALYHEDSETVKRLCSYPDPIGKNAQICVACGTEV